MRTHHSRSRDSRPEQRVRRAWPGRHLISSLVAVPVLITVAACSAGTPAAPSQPTVQAVATTAVAAASPVAATAQALAPTAQAVVSPAVGVAQSAAGTAVAAASPIATALASPSPAAQAPVRIADASLADATPWVSLHNDGAAPVDVGGWQLTVGGQSAALPEGVVIPPGETLTLHAAEGQSSEREIYLGASGESLASAAQPGTAVRLTDDDGQIVAQTTVPRVL